MQIYGRFRPCWYNNATQSPFNYGFPNKSKSYKVNALKIFASFFIWVLYILARSWFLFFALYIVEALPTFARITVVIHLAVQENESLSPIKTRKSNNNSDSDRERESNQVENFY